MHTFYKFYIPILCLFFCPYTLFLKRNKLASLKINEKITVINSNEKSNSLKSSNNILS
ncbi:hypothetical protein [Pigmentibacter ruber]|uniref:hypothetical protein n=1 Tax=Pigmentibacter ruber TaxID=2683196 RepID=UPI00131B2F91|nr:hypothetical protein [Pigmentibacter ruber]